MGQNKKVPVKTAAKSSAKKPAQRKPQAVEAKHHAKQVSASSRLKSPKKESRSTANVKSASKVAAASKPAEAKKSAPVKAPAKTAAKVARPPVKAAPKTNPPRAAAKPATPSRPAAPAATSAPRATTAAIAKPAQPKITAPVTPPPKSVAPATPKDIAVKAAEARQAAQSAASKKPVSQRHGFKTNEFIVYPAHGVGRIVGIEEQEIAGMSLELFVITFDKDKMTLRVPTGKLQSVGMRKLADDDIVKRAMETLKGRARVKRTMWSRRAQEYEAKINSGDLVSIAEVVRDLYRSETQPEQSYSERQLYESALDRMAREIAAVEKLDERGAVQRITEVLSKSARGRRLAAEEAGEDTASPDVRAA
jgi:CarD family transcriptional regulator